MLLVASATAFAIRWNGRARWTIIIPRLRFSVDPLACCFRVGKVGHKFSLLLFSISSPLFHCVSVCVLLCPSGSLHKRNNWNCLSEHDLLLLLHPQQTTQNIHRHIIFLLCLCLLTALHYTALYCAALPPPLALSFFDRHSDARQSIAEESAFLLLLPQLSLVCYPSPPSSSSPVSA